jgi:zinc protease
MPNGLKVIVVENHEQPVVAFRLLIKSGSSFDPADKPGLAGMTADLLRKGTKTRDANKIAEEIDFVGGSLDANTDLEATNATCQVLTKHFDTGMSLLSDIVLNPVFPADELERDRKQTIAQLIRRKDQPNFIAGEQYRMHLYGNHPYGKPGDGTVESVTAMKREDINGFWQKYYIPNNSVLFVVGDVKPADVFKKTAAAFGGWQKGAVPDMKPAPPTPPSGVNIVLINKPDATQSNVRMGHLGMDRYNPDIYSVRTMNYILGGGGFVSRMMQEIRQKRGLTYGVNSQYSFNRFAGDFTVSVDTRTDSTAAAVIAVIDNLNKMRTSDITPTELSETKSFYAGYFPRQFETPEQVANQMATVELYGLDKNYLADYIDKMGKVTVADVRKAAEKYIDTKGMLILVVGKADALRDGLKKIAPVQEIDISDL